MTRFGLWALMALSLFASASFAGGGKNKTDPAKPGSIDEQLTALRKEYQKTLKDGNEEKVAKKVAAAFAPRFLALAEKNAKDDAAPEALLWILQKAPQSAEMPKAVKLLEKQYLQSPRLKSKLQPLHSSEAPEVERFLRVVLEKSTDKETQGLACFALAQMLRDKSGAGNKKLRKEALGLYDLCLTKYADCPIGNQEATVGERAKAHLFEIRDLAIGKVVPEIVGVDLDGKQFKLSDYRGKVVMLNYWATWCPPCMALVPHERALVKRLQGKPFVLIGINGDRNPDKKNLKPRLEKEQITWRSFWDGQGGGGPIATKWNVHSWPTIFIIDHHGVIRSRFGSVSAETLDQAIDPLVATARKSGAKSAATK